MPRQSWLLRLDITSNPEYLAVVRNSLMSLAENLGFPAADCRALTRAVDEALANVICHAYGHRSGLPIEMSCRPIQQRIGGVPRAGIEILLMDRGAAVDHKSLCGRSLDDIRPGGLGLHFIQSGVDVMQYKRVGRKNRLRLVKYLPAVGSNSKSGKGE